MNEEFFNGTSAEFPIPFVNVMIGTFMLEALRGAADVHAALARLKLDWPRAQSAPLLTGCAGLPSALIARPSRTSTMSPQPAAHSRQVVA